MIDDDAKAYLHDELRWIREALLAKLDGLGEHDVRRPLTATGTNLLGLVKHLSTWEARYFGEVFGRPFPEPLPERGTDLWATEDETRAEIAGRYRRVWAHTDVTLFKVLVTFLTEINRHAGHADILREQLDGTTGLDAEAMAREPDAVAREARRAEIERVAEAARR
ncbi:DUF664 domain-containing protein [Amycolatopsis sp. NPDC049159]|uniref:mycothiol transferase n=1 Tax=Amycolatopsis sp. NPDC049159 TaxID=3157210 RepID=UPI0033DF0FAC